MKQYRYGTQILLLTILLFFLVTCSNTAIFYKLEKTYSTSDDRGLEDTAVVQKIVYADTAAAEDNYFTLAQSLYQRKDDLIDPADPKPDWKRVKPPVGEEVEPVLCGGMEYFSGTSEIFAWFYYSTDLEPVGLYHRDPSDGPTVDWTGRITDGDWPEISWPGKKFRVHFIKEVNGLLFVSTSVYDSSADTTTYKLYYSSDGTNDSFIASGGISPDNQILDVEHDTGSYWVITTPGEALVGDDNPTFLYEDVDDTLPDNFQDRSQDMGVPAFWEDDSDDPSGILYTPHSLYYAPTKGRLYLSGWHGRIFIHDATGWSTWDNTVEVPDRKTMEVDNDDKTVQFTAFVENSKESRIFVGSSQSGFFRFSDALVGGSTTKLKPSDIAAASGGYNNFPSQLQDSAILSFLGETETEDPDIMFVCTAGAGLWRGKWEALPEEDNITKWIWRQE